MNFHYPWLILFFLTGLNTVSGNRIINTCHFPMTDTVFLSNLPVVSIETNRRRIKDSKRIPAILKIDSVMHPVGNGSAFQGKIMIEIRGSSSKRVPKKSYSFNIIDEKGTTKPAALLGLPEESEWILYAPYSDKTLLRDVIAYKISRDLGRYATQTVFVELFINRKYAGIYVLEEKIKKSAVRVNIEAMGEKVNTGSFLTEGYILRIDRPGSVKRFLKPGKLTRYAKNQGLSKKNVPVKESVMVRKPRKCETDDKAFIESSYKPNAASWQTIDFHFYDPPASTLTAQQKQNLCFIMYNIESSLADPFPARTDSGYHKLIDMQSFIDYFIVSEITRNIDSYRLSTYFSLATGSDGSRMIMGPVWDFNLSLGNAQYCDGFLTSGWAFEYNYTCSKDPWLVPFWWERLIDDPLFRDALKCRWLNLRSYRLSNEALFNFIDEQVKLLGDAPSRNFRRWRILGKDIWPNKYYFKSYLEEIAFLKQWLTERLDWLDRNMPGDCTGITPGSSQ